MMKKSIVLSLAVLLSFLLCSCNGGEKDVSDESSFIEADENSCCGGASCDEGEESCYFPAQSIGDQGCTSWETATDESIQYPEESGCAEDSQYPEESVSLESGDVAEISSVTEESLLLDSSDSYVPDETEPEVPLTEDITNTPAVEKEPETIPKLLLWPQPEGEYHVLKVGESLQLYSQIEGEELEDAMLLWQVSDPKVIAFGAKMVTGLAPGLATVTLSYSNGLMPVSVSFLVIEAEESLDTAVSQE